MKIKGVESILKSSKTIIVCRGKLHGQWLGDGCAMYPIHNLPELTEHHLFALFDIPEEKQSKYMYQERGLPKGIDFRDCVENESVLQRGKITINAMGRELEPLFTSNGAVFINTKHLKPFSDEPDGFELYERISGDGEPYIVAKSGMLIIGIIIPFRVEGKKFLEELEQLVAGVRKTLENREAAANQILLEGGI